MICEFQKQHELDYAAKTAVVLKQVTDRRKSMNEKNVSTALDNTTDDIQEARDDDGGDDVEEEDEDEDEEHGEGLTVSGVQRTCRVKKDHHHVKRRQSGCAPALHEISPNPQPEDQDSQSHT